jgi:hypothetical protein
LAQELNLTLTEALEHAVESVRRQRVLEQANLAYAALKADPKAWQAELEERRVWEQTLFDGQKEN